MFKAYTLSTYNAEKCSSKIIMLCCLRTEVNVMLCTQFSKIVIYINMEINIVIAMKYKVIKSISTV